MPLTPTRLGNVSLEYTSSDDIDFDNDYVGIASAANSGKTAKTKAKWLRDAIDPPLEQYDYIANTTLAASQTGSLITNLGAVAAITLTLPPAIAGREFAVMRIAPYSVTVTAVGADTISGGPAAGSYVVADRVLAVFSCIVDGTWEVVLGRNTTRFHNVLDYGAVGNGAVNDSAAIQAAADVAGTASPPSTILFPNGSFLTDNTTMPANTSVAGLGRGALIKKNANGPILTLGKESNVENLRIDGEGGTYTGVGITIPATVEFEGQQVLWLLHIEDTASYCIEYSAEFAGYSSVVLGCTLKPTSVSTHAVKWGVETASNKHGDRAIISSMAAYSPLVDATGSQAGIILGCIAGGTGAQAITFDANTAKLAVVANRFGSTGATQIIDGTSHTWVGNIQAGATTLAAGCNTTAVAANVHGALVVTAGAAANAILGNIGSTVSCAADGQVIAANRQSSTVTLTSVAESNVLSGNYMAALTVDGDGNAVTGNFCTAITVSGDDNTVIGNRTSGAVTLSSGAARNWVSGQYGTIADNSGSVGGDANMVDIKPVAYTPTWTGSTGNPVLGSSTLTGLYSRKGRTVTATINLTITTGGAFDPGVGSWYFSLPFLPSTSVIQCGSARVFDSGTAHYVAMCQTLTSGAARMEVYSHGATTTASLVGATAPVTWATGDALVATITYDI